MRLSDTSPIRRIWSKWYGKLATTATIILALARPAWRLVEKASDIEFLVDSRDVLVDIATSIWFSPVVAIVAAILILVASRRPVTSQDREQVPDPPDEKPALMPDWFQAQADEQRANPTTRLFINDRIIMRNQLDNNKRPYLRLRVQFTNFGVHTLKVSDPQGYPYFRGEKSEYEIRDPNHEPVRHNVPPGNSATSFDLDVYIDKVFLADVRSEVESASGEVRGISLRDLEVLVRADVEGATLARWHIGDPLGREIFRPNR